jgi:alpha-beta hydrolase superfamily lysophospholipase
MSTEIQKGPEGPETTHADVPHNGLEAVEAAPLSFEEQFDNREYIESRDGRIGIVEVKPENLSPDDAPVVIVGGWTEGPDAFKGTMRELYRGGRWVISVDHPTHGNTPEFIEDDHPEAETAKAFMEAEAIKASNYEDVLSHLYQPQIKTPLKTVFKRA